MHMALTGVFMMMGIREKERRNYEPEQNGCDSRLTHNNQFSYAPSLKRRLLIKLSWPDIMVPQNRVRLSRTAMIVQK